MYFTFRSPLYVRAGEGGAGGGAGSGAAGASEGAAGAFDPKAFMAEIVGEFEKRINGFDKRLTAIHKLVDAKPKAGEGTGADPNAGGVDPNAAGTGAGDSQGSGAGNSGNGGDARPNPAQNAEMQAMRRELETLKRQSKEDRDARETAEKARLEGERVTNIRGVLNDIKFKDQVSRDLFFDAVSTKVVRDENGDLVVQTKEGPLPFDSYIKSHVENFPSMLAPQTTGGGAGATAGTKRAPNTINIDTMSVEQLSKLKPEEVAELSRGLAEQAKAEWGAQQ